MGDASLANAKADVQIDADDSASLLNALLRRADTILNEFKAYQHYLQQVQKSREVEARIFRRGVESEFKSLNTLMKNIASSQKNQDTIPEDGVQQARRLHTLRSSNLPFYEAIWDTAKLSRGIRALGKRVYWSDHDIANSHTKQIGKTTSKSVAVDLVSDDGLLWTKVSIVTEKRLLFDMAKEGWEDYGGDSDISDEESNEQKPDGDGRTSKLELVRLAEALHVASRSVRVRYRHPTIRFVLPRLTEGTQADIDAMIADIRATGAIVKCGPQPLTSDGLASSPPFNHMRPSSHLPILTPSLNIDCTILLALISDISHCSRDKLPPSPTSKSGAYHTAIIQQIESEEKSPLLPSEIYPTLAERRLVCTDLAAQRMREIVITMGTSTERARADVILGDGQYSANDAGGLRRALRELSTHELSDGVQLPIEEVSYKLIMSSSGSNCSSGALPMDFAEKLTISLHLSPINSSVFMYGWQHNIVTITSNRVVANQIEKALNEILDTEERDVKAVDDFEGPKLWVCDSARSLVGKDKMHGLRP